MRQLPATIGFAHAAPAHESAVHPRLSSQLRAVLPHTPAAEQVSGVVQNDESSQDCPVLGDQPSVAVDAMHAWQSFVGFRVPFG